ncbi:MAG: transposase [Calditrichaeota bacterium]|nr:MAG: transposase [Calditrichota bacterium]
MSKLRRYHIEGYYYFVTCVTFKRIHFLRSNEQLLINSFYKFEKESACSIISYTILPDHFHIIINVNSIHISKIMQKIKLSFYRKYKLLIDDSVRRVWQNRFMDHLLRDEKDLYNHLKYIQDNAVKHKYSKVPEEWEYCKIYYYKM